MITPTLTAPQLAAAWRLARAYGHEWARRTVPVDLVNGSYDNSIDRVVLSAPITPDEIYALVRRCAIGHEPGDCPHPHEEWAGSGTYDTVTGERLDGPERVCRCEPAWINCQHPQPHLSPILDDPLFAEPVVEESTGTRRTQWSVYPDGIAVIHVTRPVHFSPEFLRDNPQFAGDGDGEMVLKAVVSAEGDVAVADADGVYGHPVPTVYHRRHVAALARAVQAATGLAWEDVAADLCAAGLHPAPDEPAPAPEPQLVCVLERDDETEEPRV